MDIEKLDRTVGLFRQAARAYRTISARLQTYAEVTDLPEVADETRKILGIVYDTCVPYIDDAAVALDEAVTRMQAALGAENPETPDTTVSLIPDPDGVSAISTAMEFDHDARLLTSFAGLLNDAAAELGDRVLTGDPHPYGDMLYGICVPYLSLAATKLAEDQEAALRDE